jgi:putative two-component system response regulator
VLTKPGKLTDEEWQIMRRHPAEGAKIIYESDRQLDLASAVAYEHHIMINGGGYPSRHFHREVHQASKLVHICDVYDALRTNRPYREAWETERVLAQIQSGAGPDFDAELSHSFIQMMRQWEKRVAVVDDKTPLPHMGSAPMTEIPASGTPVVTEATAAVAAETPPSGPAA